MIDDMTRLGMLTMLYSLKALLEKGEIESVQEVIDKVIKEAETKE